MDERACAVTQSQDLAAKLRQNAPSAQHYIADDGVSVGIDVDGELTAISAGYVFNP